MDYINYSKLLDEAMHTVVKKALEWVVQNGTKGDHHFFISFKTDFPGLVLSEKLRKKYPEEMTIVLQHQFESLNVFPNYFSVKLSFNNVKETLVIPFEALTSFADPGASFVVQLNSEPSENQLEHTSHNEIKEIAPKYQDPVSSDSLGNNNNVIHLDLFRKRQELNNKPKK